MFGSVQVGLIEGPSGRWIRCFRPFRIPGDPWPNDIVLIIEDDLQTLPDLLWVREAWSLQPAGDDLAPLLSVTPVGAHNEAVPVGKIAE